MMRISKLAVLALVSLALTGLPGCQNQGEFQGCLTWEDCESGICNPHTHLCIDCLTDADCAEPERCIDGFCLLECQGDSDCGSGESCEDNRCVFAGCSSDSDCSGATPYCEAGSRTCVECLDSGQCEDLEACQNQTCVHVGCSSHWDCDGDTPMCNPATGECVECLADGDCGEMEACQGNTCGYAGCSADTDCGGDTPHCQSASGECVQCLQDADCPATEECIQNGCHPQCAADADCADALPFCQSAMQVCVECLEHLDCPAMHECQNNGCVQTGCLDDSDCGGGTPLCQTASGDCVQCLGDSDCPASWHCDSNQCQPECTANYDCDYPTPVCEPDDQVCVQCLADADCGVMETCQNHQCLPSGCLSHDDCSDPTPYCNLAGATCVECLQDDHCPGGSCLGNECQYPVNQEPQAANDTAGTDEDTPVDIDVLANDSDPDSDPLRISQVTQPAHGVVSFSDTQVTYTPEDDYAGSDQFNYTVADDRGGSASAQVDITVDPVNDAPTAEAQSFEVDEMGIHTGTLTGSDPENDPLTFAIADNGVKGDAILSNPATGEFSYTPHPGESGDDTFTFVVNDGDLVSPPSTVSVNIHAVDCNSNRFGPLPIDLPVLSLGYLGGTLLDAVVDHQGRTVATGYRNSAGPDNNQLTVVRYLPDGTLDTSFGVGGQFSYDLSAYPERGDAVTLTFDGKIVVAGTFDLELVAFADRLAFVVRLNQDGTLDTSFNPTGESGWQGGPNQPGIAVFEPMKVIPMSYIPPYWHQITDVVVDKEGYVFVGGSGHDSNFNISINSLSPDGALMTRAFLRGIPLTISNPDYYWQDLNGFITSVSYDNFQDQLYGLALDSQCRLLATGSSDHTWRDGQFYYSTKLWVARMVNLEEGNGKVLSLDPSFGHPNMPGAQVFNFNNPDFTLGSQSLGWAVGAAADDSVYVVGMQRNTWNRYLVLHFDANGQLDQDFGTQGIYELVESGHLLSGQRKFALDAQDRLLISVGWVEDAGIQPPMAQALRFTPSNTIDLSFGSGGVMNLGTYDPLHFGVDANDQPVLIAR